jgi:cysteine-S-conjugate beta-lyase
LAPWRARGARRGHSLKKAGPVARPAPREYYAGVTYDFDRIIERRGTSSLKWDYDQKLCGVAGVLPLWVADMDFAAPPQIVEALRERVAHGVFGYTLEPESYFDAARKWFLDRHGWSVPRDWMRTTPGVIPGLSAAILALTEPGDGIVIQPPVYYPFALRIRANKRRIVENPLRLNGERWEMDFASLQRVMDRGTRMLVLCSPHNPVCRVWKESELRQLAEICAGRGVVIVSDEIHCDLVMEGFRHVPIASVSEDAARSTVTLVSATKSFNLAGLGGALAIIASPRLRERFDEQQKAIFVSLGNAPAIAAMEAAWRGGGEWLDQVLRYVAGNYACLTAFLAARLPRVRAFPLEGTYLAWLDMRGLGLSDTELKERLLQGAGVWLDEGPMFGRGGEGFQRLNLACPRGILTEALGRMEAALGDAARG